MLAIIPLMLHWDGGIRQRLYTRRVRVWAVLLAGSVAANLLPALVLGVPPPLMIVGAYMLIDLASGLAVLLPKPVGCAQRTIGGLFAGMVCFDMGFFLASNGSNIQAYVDTLEGVGWLQWACLFAWGGYDVGKVLIGNRWAARPAVSGRTIAS